MNNFLDTCFIIGYANAGIASDYEKYEVYAKDKKDNFYVCYFVLEKEIPRLIKRYSEMFKELKSSKPDFKKLLQDKKIRDRELQLANKLLVLKELKASKGEDLLPFINKLEEVLYVRIDFFLTNLINKKVIPLSEIDKELASAILTWTQNFSDSNIIASGVQFHNKEEEEIVLVTSDRNDWTKEHLEDSITLHPTLRLKYKKLPEIKYF
jgi:hypothetical protein